MSQIYHWGNSADLITLATYLTHYVNLPLPPPQLKGKHLLTLIRTAGNTKSKNLKKKKKKAMLFSASHNTRLEAITHSESTCIYRGDASAMGADSPE